VVDHGRNGSDDHINALVVALAASKRKGLITIPGSAMAWASTPRDARASKYGRNQPRAVPW